MAVLQYLGNHQIRLGAHAPGSVCMYVYIHTHVYFTLGQENVHEISRKNKISVNANPS